MFTKKTIGIAVAGALALCASGSALATVVDGIQFSSGAVFESTQLYESQVTGPGQALSGYGFVNAINGDTGNYCVGGTYSCQLTYTFTGYTVTQLSPTKAVFSGGTVTFYAYDGGRTFNAADPNTASMGKVFLTATGHTFLATTGDMGTLVATAVSGDFTTSQFQGNGSGLLDVTGGDAWHIFDTNTFTDNFPVPGFADIQFISDFSPNSCGNSGTPEPICGSATVKSLAVPEPGPLGMMGLGLGVLGLFFWRRRKEEAAGQA